MGQCCHCLRSAGCDQVTDEPMGTIQWHVHDGGEYVAIGFEELRDTGVETYWTNMPTDVAIRFASAVLNMALDIEDGPCTCGQEHDESDLH